jgi:hypothetical protein
LYQAFSELGRAVRTGFLMEYLGSQELRSSIPLQHVFDGKGFNDAVVSKDKNSAIADLVD